LNAKPLELDEHRANMLAPALSPDVRIRVSGASASTRFNPERDHKNNKIENITSRYEKTVRVSLEIEQDGDCVRTAHFIPFPCREDVSDNFIRFHFDFANTTKLKHNKINNVLRQLNER